jgi:hypothetical protein
MHAFVNDERNHNCLAMCACIYIYRSVCVPWDWASVISTEFGFQVLLHFSTSKFSESCGGSPGAQAICSTP